ncbi:hypothetical protein KAR91_45640 [Candidatus Pacearchaeota archaeon]|nr:hypothetical protein [Candidatus Pacearchaeota archaeon]
MKEKKQMGRKRFGPEKRYMVGIAMDPTLHKRLKKEAEGTGVSISLTACEAIDKFLTAREKTRAMFGM